MSCQTTLHNNDDNSHNTIIIYESNRPGVYTVTKSAFNCCTHFVMNYKLPVLNYKLLKGHSAECIPPPKTKKAIRIPGL